MPSSLVSSVVRPKAARGAMMESPPTRRPHLSYSRGSRQRKRPRQSSRVRRCPMAFVPGAAGGAMRACPPERSTARSHSAPPRPIPDANSLPSASHELSHGAQASTPAPAKPSCPAARARRGIAASHSRCLPHDACRCRHPPSARRTSFTLMRWCTVLYPATSDGATFEPVVQSACRTRTPHRCRDHGCFRVGHAWWWSRSEPVCIDDARLRKY